MAQGHQERDWFLELLDEHGRPLWSGNHAPGGFPPPGNGPPRVVAAEGYRVAERTLTAPALPRYVIRVGTSTEFIEADVAKLTEITLPVGAAIVLLSPLGGFWLAGRATRPLADINARTAKLRPSNLRERLPLRGTGDELDQLSVTTNRFLDRIATHLQHNEQFVHNAAHELRSPLTAIQSSVEVALGSDRSVAEYKELLELILAECGELSVLVNQLLLLAETDAELRAPKQRVQLDRVVARSLDMFRGLAEERRIALEADLAADVWVEGHPARLRQVVNNLLDNSLKFTPDGGRVRVRLTSGDKALAELTVADSGVGISPTDLPRVFDRFFRGEVGRVGGRAARGSGLGLSICQSIVEAHGGQVEVQSALGAGTTMTVRLPRVAAGPAAKG